MSLISQKWSLIKSLFLYLCLYLNIYLFLNSLTFGELISTFTLFCHSTEWRFEQRSFSPPLVLNYWWYSGYLCDENENCCFHCSAM